MAETTVSNEHAVASGSSASPEVLTNFVGGRWVESKARETLDVHNPARGEVIARTPLSTAEDVATAVAAAKKAFPAWRDTPPVVRARAMFQFKQILEEHLEEIARIVTTEHGNTLLVKPSEQVPLSQRRIFQLLEKCDFPPGVLNLVNGSREVVEAICDHPDIRAVSFVGSTPVARAVYQRATHAGKRVQAL